MTVCIAAACEGGRKCVTATDGLLTFGGITADVLPDKRRWKGEWQFMYAGRPENATLIFGELDELVLQDPEAKSRRNVQRSVLKAYRTFISLTSSFPTLSQFDMDMEEFKQEGLRIFGKSLFAILAGDIGRTAASIDDQILVVGWGHAPASVMLYEVGPYGPVSHGQAGLAAIGSGSAVALSNLLLLGQSRHSTLSETLYNVAAAKFASEHSTGLAVGPSTNIHVSWKREADDDPDQIVGTFVEDTDVQHFRKIWDRHGRPRMPDEAVQIAARIASEVSGFVSVKDIVTRINAAANLAAPREVKDTQVTTSASSSPKGDDG